VLVELNIRVRVLGFGIAGLPTQIMTLQKLHKALKFLAMELSPILYGVI
jgi:hypothetical protein